VPSTLRFVQATFSARLINSTSLRDRTPLVHEFVDIFTHVSAHFESHSRSLEPTRRIAVGIGVGFDWVAIIIGLGVETATGAVGLRLGYTATSGGVVGSSRKYSRHLTLSGYCE
jgi:hypothetical protein